MKMLCKKDDPFLYHYLVGGRPWYRNGELARIYFDGLSLRGLDWWLAPFSGCEGFPSGYFDVTRGEWFGPLAWERSEYAQLMESAIERRTLAPRKPPRELRTRDGVKIARGMIVMFTGSLALNKSWDMSQVQGRLLVAVNRFSDGIPEGGRIRSWGPMKVPVREYASHAYPSAWVVAPLHEDSPLVVSSRSFDAEWGFLVVDPETQLTSISGGGRRFIEPADIPEIGDNLPKILVIA